jgi:hypothetical protein
MLDQKKGGSHPDVASPTRSYEESNQDGNQLDQAVQTILRLLGKVADITESNSRQAMEKLRDCRRNCALPKTGLCSSRLRLRLATRKLTEPSCGCIRFTPK